MIALADGEGVQGAMAITVSAAAGRPGGELGLRDAVDVE